MQRTALFALLGFIVWLFARDIRRRRDLSPALWFVLAWVVIIGSRAVSTWLDVGREVGGSAGAYDEGNPFERNIYFVLLAAGLTTLVRRGVRLPELIKQNKWLAIFFGYWLLSTLWADLPFVAFKRWIKDSGNLVMVLVILTDPNPVEAAKAVFVRCACLLVPLSVLFIRYYPELGRAYHAPSGEMMFTGVAAHKNTLGMLVMVCALVLVWDLLSRLKQKMRPVRWTSLIPEMTLLGMTVWLLLKSHSATSLACTIVGLAVFLGLKAPAIKARIDRLEVYAVVGGALFWVLNSMFDLSRLVVEGILGRDMTLTTRTEVWPVLLSQADSQLFGSGFMAFWSGKRFEVLYEQYGIIQAHSGYIEVFLNGGWVAVAILAVLLFSASRSIKQELGFEGDWPAVRFMFLVVAVLHNFTEATISKGGLVWFVLLLALVCPPTGAIPGLAGKAIPTSMQEDPGLEGLTREATPSASN
jgi:exopolysaccharide production protein ExoQ